MKPIPPLLLILALPAVAQVDGGAPEAPQAAVAPAPEAPPPPPLTELSEADRRARVAKMSKDELATFMTTTPSEALVKMGQKAVAGLGTYTYTMTKQERVGGKLLDEQQITTTLRESPFAVRLEFVAGPAKGRKVIYNPAVKADEFRVREAGFFSIAGRLWISLDSGLAKKDSNHTVKESGLGNLLRRFERDQAKAKTNGGMTIKHEGWDAKGHYCSLYVMPNKGAGFDSASSRICTDVAAGVPVRVEGFDASGALLERFEFSNVKKASVSDDTFDPDKGL
ncbi:MAG: hypothetical protein AMXMBFR34_30510 [Myxococcaceae bacterium]